MTLALSSFGLVIGGGLAWWFSGNGDVAFLGSIVGFSVVNSWVTRRGRSGQPPKGATINKDGDPIFFGDGDWGAWSDDGGDFSGGGFEGD